MKTTIAMMMAVAMVSGAGVVPVEKPASTMGPVVTGKILPAKKAVEMKEVNAPGCSGPVLVPAKYVGVMKFYCIKS